MFRRQETAEEVRSERQRHAGGALNGRKSEQMLIRLQGSRREDQSKHAAVHLHLHVTLVTWFLGAVPAGISR